VQDDLYYDRKLKLLYFQKTQTLPKRQTILSNDHTNLQPSHVSQNWLKNEEYSIKNKVQNQ